MTQHEHPIEALHQARDAVNAAAAGQATKVSPSLDELHAFGSAIVATLNGLHQLSGVLTGQLADYDIEEIRRATLADRPVDELRAAALHMTELSEDLRLAAANANRYWTAIEHVDENTADPPHRQGSSE